MSSDGSGSYVFARHEDAEEAARLHVQERAFDPFSRLALLENGLRAGASCLDVGVGAGSVVRWMAGVVGSEGRVVGVDIDDRFFSLSASSRAELVVGDIREVSLPEASFHLVHARLLMTHLPDRAVVVDRLTRLLRPGGALVLVDIDMSWTHPAPNRTFELWQRRNAAVLDFLNRNTTADFSVGSMLPQLLGEARLAEIDGFQAAPLLIDGGIAQQLLLNSVDSAMRMGLPQGLTTEELDELRERLSVPGVATTDRTSSAAGFTIVVAWGRRLRV